MDTIKRLLDDLNIRIEELYEVLSSKNQNVICNSREAFDVLVHSFKFIATELSFHTTGDKALLHAEIIERHLQTIEIEDLYFIPVRSILEINEELLTEQLDDFDTPKENRSESISINIAPYGDIQSTHSGLALETRASVLTLISLIELSNFYRLSSREAPNLILAGERLSAAVLSMNFAATSKYQSYINNRYFQIEKSEADLKETLFHASIEHYELERVLNTRIDNASKSGRQGSKQHESIIIELFKFYDDQNRKNPGKFTHDKIMKMICERTGIRELKPSTYFTWYAKYDENGHIYKNNSNGLTP